MNVASKHIEGHYKVVGVVPGEVIPRDGKKVDLRTISLERAHELHASGFRYLKKVSKEPASKQEALNVDNQNQKPSNDDKSSAAGNDTPSAPGSKKK